MADVTKVQQFARATLAPPAVSGSMTFSIKNKLPIRIRAEKIRATGGADNLTGVEVDPGETKNNISTAIGQLWLISSADVGAILDVATINQSLDEYVIKPVNLLGPQDMGAVPAATASSPAPGDTLPVVIGVGEADSNNKLIIRARFWHRTDQQINLGPGGSATWQIVTSEGVDQSTSVITSVAAALNTSASAGWGPISGSISASLSASSSTTTEINLTNSTTVTQTRAATNPKTDQSLNQVLWQIQDRYWIIKKDNRVVKANFTDETNQQFVAAFFTSVGSF